MILAAISLTGLLTLLLYLAIVGFVIWLILQIPVPDIWRKVMLAVVLVVLILWVISWLGGAPALPSLR